MQNILVYFFFCILSIFTFVFCDNVVETKYGKVRGFHVLTQSDDPRKSAATVFLGIPFAKPPVDELRFEKPVPPSKWDGVRDAKAFADACVPIARAAMYLRTPADYSEDCLYLNVMAPAWPSKNKSGFPVLLYIHGGAFEVSHAFEFGYDNFVENYLPRDVLVVTIQYRLAHLGFATMDDEKFAGNYGLWDQRAALKFVHENIVRFGGDPNRVTLWGHSAGAASVSHLSASPHTRELFSGAIQMSGSAFAEWTCSERVVAPTIALVRALECEGANVSSVKRCLQRKSIGEFLDASEKMGIPRKNEFHFMNFMPRIDGDFHAQNLTNSLVNGLKIPTMLGVADLEATLFVLLGVYRELTDLHIAPSEFATANENSFRDFVAKFIAKHSKVGSSQKVKELQEMIFDFYVNKAEIHDPWTDGHAETSSFTTVKDYKFYLKQQIKIVSDEMFVVPTLVEAEAKSRLGWPVFLYRFSHFNPRLWYSQDQMPVEGGMHGGEYPYLFALPPNSPANFDADDRAFKENFVEAIVTFASTGFLVFAACSLILLSLYFLFFSF